MNRLLLGLAALSLVAIATPATALTRCMPTSSTSTTTVTAEGQTLYAVNDDCAGECLFSAYLYRESNGISGLQRMDAMRDDTCGGAFPADQMIV